jgi:hypothetical protein
VSAQTNRKGRRRFLTIDVLYTESGKGIYTMGFPAGDGDFSFYAQIEDTLYLAEINNLLGAARRLDRYIGGWLIG